MATNSQLFINWSEPAKVNTKYGNRWLRWWVIPQDYLEGFFVFWNKNKLKLKLQGYGITKNKIGKWSLQEWQLHRGDFKDDFGRENKPKIDASEIPTQSTLPEYIVKNVAGLRKFQVPIVSKLCASIIRNGAALDGSDTGAGKTYAAVGVARELNIGIAVVCPLAVISAWKTVITKHFGLQPVFILNYESIKTGKHKDIGVWKRVSKISTRENFHWTVPKNTLIIFDESHRLKGHSTQNSELGTQAKKQGYKILCCSATNAINPVELKAVGLILGLYKQGKWTEFLRNHDCEKGRFGWEFGGNKNVLKKLHYDLFLERGVRIKREDIEGFPDCDIIAEAYNIDNSSEKELKQVYNEMEAELKKLQVMSKNTKEYQMNALVVMLRARQKAELIKVPLFVEMAEEAIADGMSVAIFVNFSETVRALSKRLDSTCIVWGENKGDERDRSIADFQSDKRRVIIINIKAGGAGLSLHDLNGNYPRMALISPTPSAVDLRQALGRVWRDGGKTKALQKIIFVANTVEEEVCEKVKFKLQALDTINDGDVSMGTDFN
jgi:superfamily II DNA or RNA helicase